MLIAEHLINRQGNLFMCLNYLVCHLLLGSMKQNTSTVTYSIINVIWSKCLLFAPCQSLIWITWDLKYYRMAYMVLKTPRLNFNRFNYRHRLAR